MSKKKLTKKIWYGSDIDNTGQPIIPPLAKNPDDLNGLHEGELFLYNSDEQPNIWIRTSGGRIVPLFKGGGGTADGISWINITDKPAWLVDGIIDYSEIVGAPDLSLYAKKSYVDSTFVTLSGNEDVSGIKNFTNGIKLSGVEFKYDSANNAVCLQKADGTPINFYVTGGLSMYGQGNTSVKSIMDAIAANLDSNTLAIQNGLLTVIGGTGGVDEDAVRTLIESYDYATKDFVRDYVLQNATGGEFELSKQMVIDALGFTPYSAENPNGYITAASIPSALKNPYALTFGSKTYDGSAAKSITASDLGAALSSDLSKYLPLSGGTITGSSVSPLTINSTNSENKCYIPFTVNGVIKAYVGYSSAVGAFLEVPNGTFRVNTTGITYNGNTVYHAGNFNPANYLPLSGGTIQVDNVGKFNVYNTAQDGSYVHFFATINSAKTDLGYIGVNKDKVPTFMTSGGVANKIWHAGNDGSGSGLDADLLDGKHLADILASNVASATKLQTARTIFGQPFDGSSNVSGLFRSIIDTTKSNTLHKILAYPTSPYGLITRAYDNGNVSLQVQREADDSECFNLILNHLGGNVGVGIPNPSCKLHVAGDIAATAILSSVLSSNFNDVWSDGTNSHVWYGYDHRYPNSGVYSTTISDYFGMTLKTANIGVFLTQTNMGVGISKPSKYLHIGGTFGNDYVYANFNTANPYLALKENSNTWYVQGLSNYLCIGLTSSKSLKIDANGNVLVVGGLTMQSQRSLKNVVDERGLSLTELSAIKPTRYMWKDKRDNRIHFGGIADDIEKVLPEVIYKTSDGTLTMDYGNAGFAIASSLIKPVIDHDTEIRMLKIRVKELEEELKRYSA